MRDMSERNSTFLLEDRGNRGSSPANASQTGYRLAGDHTYKDTEGC